MRGTKLIDLVDPLQGEVKLLVPLPQGDEIWGVFAPLKGTDWGKLITVVHGDLLSHALHGYATPLMQVIGIAPEYRARRAPPKEKHCLNIALRCPIAGSHCQPGKKVPDCYEPSIADLGVKQLVTQVVLAWKENRYVIVVEGKEFSL